MEHEGTHKVTVSGFEALAVQNLADLRAEVRVLENLRRQDVTSVRDVESHVIFNEQKAVRNDWTNLVMHTMFWCGLCLVLRHVSREMNAMYRALDAADGELQALRKRVEGGK